MSQESMDVVRTAFQAFERGDVEGVLGRCDENVEVTQDSELVELLGIAPRQVGHDGVLEAFAVWPQQWDDFSLEVLRTADLGSYLMVTTMNRGRGRDSGIRVEMPFTFLFSVRAGKITEWRIFIREEKALEAAESRAEAMSENVDLVRSVLAEWECSNFRSTSWAHPDIEYIVIGGPEPGTWNGVASMRASVGAFMSAWRDYGIEAQECRGLDDERVLALVRLSGRGKTSGLEIQAVQATGAEVWHVRRGQVIRLVLYWDRDQALADLGLVD